MADYVTCVGEKHFCIAQFKQITINQDEQEYWFSPYSPRTVIKDERYI